MGLIRFAAGISVIKAVLFKDVPLYVQIQTTPLCNHDCEFCGVIHSFNKKKTLTFDDFVVMSDNLKKMSVGVVVLTGGEPMLRKDIFEIVKLFSDKGIEVRLQTNGSLLTKDVIGRFNDAGLSGLTISLDSLHEKNMDALTRRKNFRKIIEGIINSVKYGKFNVVALNIVINKSNIDEIEDIVRFGSEMNVFTSLIPIHNENKIFSNKSVQEDKNFFTSEEDFTHLKSVLDRLKEMKQKGFLIINSKKHLAGIYSFMRDKAYTWRCDSPYLYFSIRPDGTFAPCIEYTTRYDFTGKDFIKTYNSKAFQEEISKIVDNCNGCYYPCWSEVSFFVKNPLILFERFMQLMTRKRVKDVDYDAIIKKYVKFDGR